MFVINRRVNQLVLDEDAGIGSFGVAFKMADLFLQKGYTLMRTKNAQIKRLIRQRVWMKASLLPGGKE